MGLQAALLTLKFKPMRQTIMTIQTNTIHTGNSEEVLKTFPENCIDAIVTDPPYGISFLGLDWDSSVPDLDIWKEALRVLKPGGHLLAFSGSRTYHQMAINIEKAGFEIRDQIMWLYSSGFPRSFNISKGIEKKYSATEAQNWAGWGTTLKPAHEPIVVARKPFSGTVTDNVLQFGTGGLNIDACRNIDDFSGENKQKGKVISMKKVSSKGRFPANVIHDGLDELWSPYFYCAKPSSKERDAGLESFALKQAHERTQSNASGHTAHRGAGGSARNFHPTVKPTLLMEYLIKLVTPEDGIVLDPFAGSGSTLIAAQNLGYPYIGIELDAEYVGLSKARLAA